MTCTLSTLVELKRHHTVLAQHTDLGHKPIVFKANGVGLPKAFKSAVLKANTTSAHQELARQTQVREALALFQDRLKDFRRIMKDAGGELPADHWAKNIGIGFYPNSTLPFLSLNLGPTRDIHIEDFQNIADLLNAHQDLDLKGPFQLYDLAQPRDSLMPYIVAADTPHTAYKRLCLLLQDAPNSWRSVIMRQHIDGDAIREDVRHLTA